MQPNQSKLPCMSLGSIHACHSDRCKQVTRIEACSMPPHPSIPVASHHYVHQSKLPCMSLGSINACHSDRCKDVTRIEACSMPPNQSIQVASHNIHQSKLPCMSLGSRHIACHQINQFKLPATTYINPSCHACHSDRCMHVTRIDASKSLRSINPSC
jgi:hypothetical protein